MAVNTLRFEHQGRIQWGIVRNGRITSIPGDFPSTSDFVRATNVDKLAALVGTEIDATQVKVLAPITRDRQFVCQGANYRQHMIESGMNPDTKTFNMIFTKASSCIVPADSEIVRPACVRYLDYEIELGVVIKRDLTTRISVTDANLHEFVAGIVIVNDYSARDIQIPQMQFYKGKSFRTFGPVGPYLCLLQPQDMRLLKELELQLTVNAEIRQSDNTKNLVFGTAETLTELSGIQDLFAGDLLATGTPAGCALSIPSGIKQRIGALLPERRKWAIFLQAQAQRRQYLKDGDVVEARIRSADGSIDLGVQRNKIVAQTAFN